MRRLILLVPLVLFVAGTLFFYQTLRERQASEIRQSSIELPSPLIGKPLPAFELEDVKDAQRRITAADLKGPALVNVWATWCVACRVEHPVLNRLAEQGVVIYGINYKDDNASAQRWLRDLHDPYQINVSDPQGRLGLDLGVYGAPETFLIDADGIIRYKFIGVIDDRVWERELEPRYQALLEGGT